MVEINHGVVIQLAMGITKRSPSKPVILSKKAKSSASWAAAVRSTGPHVHFEVFKNGRIVDPASYSSRQSLILPSQSTSNLSRAGGACPAISREIHYGIAASQQNFWQQNERQLKRMGRLVDQIATYEEDFGKLSDADLAGQREVFSSQARGRRDTRGHFARAFATVRRQQSVPLV